MQKTLEDKLPATSSLLAVAAIAAVVGSSAPPAAAGDDWVDQLRTPTRKIDCEFGREGRRYFVYCSADRTRDDEGCRTYYRVRDRGHARRIDLCGDPAVNVPTVEYGRWYYIHRDALRRRGDRSMLRCRARRGRGLRCVNRSRHGFVVSRYRSRRF